MGLNSRKAQIVAAAVPVISAGLLLAAPFVWRALRLKKRGDIWTAVTTGVLQAVVYIAFAVDQSPQANRVSNATGAVVWFCAFTAMLAAAWAFRPLSKDEQMERARTEQRPGSTYL